ncbi:hypothetical protein [Acaryochloris sp. IP29b_bin.148]|uniref:hypothetical protein n=1 Tax=Acaryochloris sp. IP29b_bin.148 TaxID=2969218 RepID=UPI0026308CA8|nr:hypothetical protein [Acaryochloris sp. IP29b_bin.148]
MPKNSPTHLGEAINRLVQLRDLCSNLAISVDAGLIPAQIAEICEIGAEELQDIGRELSRHNTSIQN